MARVEATVCEDTRSDLSATRVGLLSLHAWFRDIERRRCVSRKGIN